MMGDRDIQPLNRRIALTRKTTWKMRWKLGFKDEGSALGVPTISLCMGTPW